ncbi:pirin family protein [Azotobacter beijerinckii]|uniref:Pirin N-terminal domain-containing protein n=1 Tax=Azotobacter beijerinckii TaxID=170623 RepID=A0A1I4HVF2_9GAMM|nr:pirin family protein [Azotobacter beijerinckii]SFL45820.1 hypothetical protein SAMN04244574_04369 [Azotobacter beijerinckii]
MNELLKSSARGQADHGWLQSRHSFSFASYYNPEQVGFSDLCVINDDWVQPGEGFGRHPHRNMEIFSYVLEGALEHKDSLGNGSVILPGDIQLMNAGSGVTYSEFNASAEAPVHFLQIWIVPNQIGIVPGYQQQHFAVERKRGRLCLMLSPDGAQGSVPIYQDVRVYAGLFDGQETATLEGLQARYVYVHLARGSLKINDQLLQAGDGLKIRQTDVLKVHAGIEAEVLIFDLRPNELPEKI